jgi:predicted Zn-dependent protease
MKGDHALSLRTFQAALDQARGSDASLWLLHGLAQAWSWPAALVAASGEQVSAFPKDPRPYPVWVAHIRAAADTKTLNEVLDGWRTADPANLEARYNWAITTLLLPAPRPSSAAVDVLEKFYQSDPTNPLYITGAAFARFREGQFKSAADLLAKLKPAALQRPERAPYAAVIFAAAGRYDQSRAVQRFAPAPSALLPEERQLLRQAAAQCGG